MIPPVVPLSGRSTAAGSRRTLALDGWRAAACLLVLFYHTGFTLRWGPLMVWGFTGVHLFFVLSGYLLFRPFCKAMLAGASFDFTDFYVRRLLRIYPPYLLALIIFTAVRYATRLHPPDAHNLITHLLFAFNTSNDREFFGINAIFWTLAIEMQFYLLLPLLAALVSKAMRGRPVRAVHGTALLFLVIGLAARAVEISRTTGPGAPAEGIIRFHTVFSFLDLFACGMFVAAHTGAGWEAETRRRSIGWLALAGGAALFLLANAWCVPAAGGGDWLESNRPGFLWAFPTVLCAGAAAVLFAVLRGDTFLTGLLALRPLAYVGRISYSIYLFHILVQLPMFKLLPLNSVSSYYLRTLCWGLISLGPTLLLATGTYYLVELPFLRLAERFKSQRRGSALVPVPPLAPAAPPPSLP